MHSVYSRHKDVTKLKANMQQQQFKKEILVHKDQMYRLALRMLQNKDDAQDIVQDCLIKLWNKRFVLKNINSYKSFALTTVRNASIDMIRKRKYNTNHSELNLKTEDPNPEKQLDLSDQVKRMKLIIEQLPQQQRELIQLREIEGLEYSEICEISGLSLSNARVIISRARKEIRKKMLAELSIKTSINQAI